MSALLEKIWYKKHAIQWLFSPFAYLYQLIARIRRWYLQCFCQVQVKVPVIVVGNITVGGVGKTPIVIALASELKKKGLRVGIVSRGYGAKRQDFPYEVKTSDSAYNVGDEPLLIALKTDCPVVIAPKRNEAVQYLLDKHQCEIIISDDGLQHYRMGRCVEIVVIDGTRGLGNGFCLPVGPLRESEKRLQEADFVIVTEGLRDKAFSMTLKPGKLTHLFSQKTVEWDALNGEIAAVAAIGNPQRFFSTLSQLGVNFNAYPYPDHYRFSSNDLQFNESIVVMTEKDAVKCRLFNSDKLYYLPVEAVLDGAFWEALWSHKQLQGCIQ